MKLLKSCALILIATAFVNTPAIARMRSGAACYSVDAKRGWQYLQLSNTFSRVASIEGEWTADVLSYGRVGPGGHTDIADEDYSGYKYDATIPLGALLIGAPGTPYSWLNEPQSLSQPVSNVALRINDDDAALENNFGSIRVCFSN
jgi:hypothetical protein